MEYYIGKRTDTLHQSFANLFTLRYDLHIPGFDEALFAIVPKFGKLTVHFLREVNETANLYHNIIFDHNNTVAHEALYARFAWSVIKMASRSNAELFEEGSNNEDSTTGKAQAGERKGDRKGSGSQKKRSARNKKGEDDETNDGRNDKASSSKHQAWDIFSLGHDSWLSDVLFKMAPGNESSLANDLHEIQEDIRQAERDHPFLGMRDVNIYEPVLMYADFSEC